MEKQEHSVHPLVGLDYRVRVSAMGIVGLMLVTFYWDAPKGFWLWTAIVFTGLLWPQLAYAAARLSPDSKAAELRNLLFDSFILGCWTAGIAFSPLPSMMMVTAIIAACLSVGGVRFSLWA